MRLILMAVVLIGLFGSAVYSANITGAARKLGGTGNISVSNPNTGTTRVIWLTFNTSGAVTVARVRWTPAANSNYVINLYVLNASGTVLANGNKVVTGSGTSERDDNITLSAAVTVSNIASVRVNIKET